MGKSLGRFFPGSGAFEERTRAMGAWIRERTEAGLWPYGIGAQEYGPVARVHAPGIGSLKAINLTSVDYLGLAQHPRLAQAAIEAIEAHGVHTPSSAPLMGAGPGTRALEAELCDFLGREHVFLCPTGWAAAFTALAGVVRRNDVVVMDELAHQCLQQAAYASSEHVRRFRHLDDDHLESVLREVREAYPKQAILVVTEGLFSMDGDSPDFAQMVPLCRRYGAGILVDVAHDLGSVGPGGRGALARSGALAEVDIVAGSFSKCLGTNGGFVSARSEDVAWAQRCFGGPYTYSTALGPVPVAVAREALAIVRSAEGEERRERLRRRVRFTREGAAARSLAVYGQPSPIVSVHVGGSRVARLAGRNAIERGLVATYLEFPVVKQGAARFRLSLSPDHEEPLLDLALDMLADAIGDAAAELDEEIVVPAQLARRAG
ncbi:MAG: pyridoxal phosphate-dependent aminotransferase family protein [Myxococcota bacterium]